MKKIITLLICFTIFSNTKAQTPNFEWAKKTEGFSIITSKIDNEGNVYSTGRYLENADFDLSSSVYHLANNGISSVYISKSDSNGNLLWVTQDQSLSDFSCGGNGILSLAIDINRNVYLSNGGNLSKFDVNGTLVWQKPIAVLATSLAIDNQNNIILTGTFEGEIDFDPSAAIYNLTAQFRDIFILKLNSNGDFIFAKQTKTSNYPSSRPFSIATDNLGNLLLNGWLIGATDFDPSDSVFNLSNTSTTSTSFAEFIVKLDNLGNFVWAKKIENIDTSNEKNNFKVDAIGNSYLGGFILSTVDFDPNDDIHTLTALNIFKGNNIDTSFLLKLDPNGNFVWANQLDDVRNIDIDNQGNVYTIGNSYSYFPGSHIYKFNSAGINQWSLNGSKATNISVDSLGGMYTYGEFIDSVDFDLSSSEYILSSQNYSHFICKMSENSLLSNINTENNSNFQVYPNPTNGLINIKSNTIKPDYYEITDINGKLVTKGIPENIKPIDITNFQNGIYFLTIQTEKSKDTFKIIKK